MILTVKEFCIVNEAEVDFFLEFFCFLYGPMNVKKLISHSSAFNKANQWKPLVHILPKPSLKDFDYNLTSMWKGEGNGTPLQYCGLENPMDGGAW